MTDRASRPPISTLVTAGRARIPATAVIRGGRLVNVVSAEIIRLGLEHAPGASRRVSFCTDDVVASDVLDRGHLDNMVRMAVEAGIEPMAAVQMATLNGAEAYRVDHLVGSISPGRYADVVFVDDLRDFRASMVMAAGEIVARDGALTADLEPPGRSGLLTGPFPMAPAAADDFSVATELPDGPVEVLAIGLTDQTTTTSW